MNATQKCPTCLDAHSPNTKCSPEILKYYIKELREEILVLRGAAKEGVKTAEDFQKIIRGITPELERLVKIEQAYNKLIEEQRGAEELQADPCEGDQLTLI
jgi:glycerol-3-phosphate dehydrogenase